MAAQSKLVLPGRSIKSIVSELTHLYVANRTRISRVVYLALLVALINRVRNAISEQKAASVREAEKRRSGTTSSGSNAPSKKKVELNREFFSSLLRLLRICVPGWRSKETRLLFSHSFFLVVRTLISLKVAEMDGAIVKALVKGNGREFLMRIVWWMLIAMPATFTNSMLSYHQAELSLKYRTRLTQHIHDKYLSQLTFYGISALDDRINNPDQLIAVDVAKFSNSLAELYSNLAKPILDMVRPRYPQSCMVEVADRVRRYTHTRYRRA
jgi:ATP-binding cassette, subfamily D (ALD), peroxisomal long-chain fatty acid import protein